MQNKTMEAIADAMPQNKEEFIQVKGLGERKFEKYGREIIGLIHGASPDYQNKTSDNHIPQETYEKKVFSISQLLDIVNEVLTPYKVSIRGEITSFKYQRHLYFTVKDPEDESMLNALMWESDLAFCDIQAEEGLEVMLHGYLEVYKPFGKLTFRAQTMELVGEGALKKAYDELKKKLSQEGLFDEERKKDLPQYPLRLGVITSRYGAVIHDLLNNLGKYGYHIQMYDARVEGAQATRELIEAIEYFRDQPIDALLVIRGGGSLESLQAFNSERLIRSIIAYPVPVIAGIGHDKDVPLFSMVADAAFSTPTAVAREINKTWDQAVQRLHQYESSLIHRYAPLLLQARRIIDKAVNHSEHFCSRISSQQHVLHRRMNAIVHQMDMAIKNYAHETINKKKEMNQKFNNQIQLLNNKLEIYLADLKKNDPEHQLKKGYSLALGQDQKVVSSIKQVRWSDLIQLRMSDGSIKTVVQEINPRE